VSKRLNAASFKQCRTIALGIYRVRRKKYPLKIFCNVSPTTEKLKKIYTPFVCSYLHQISKFYSIIFNFDKVMPLSTIIFEFLISLKNAKNCNISATVRQTTKFKVMTQNMPLKCMAAKNLNFTIQKWRTAAILKTEKLQYFMMMQTGSL